jgi:DNA-binding NarL/FixJ family response regulator
MTVRAALADDHPMYRLSYARSSTPPRSAGEALDDAEFLALVARCPPEVVLTDLSMPPCKS